MVISKIRLTTNLKVNKMIEAAVALFLALLVFAVGYGNLQEKVKANKQTSDERYTLVQKELDAMKESNDDTKKVLNEIQVALRGVSGDIHYIKKAIEKLEEK